MLDWWASLCSGVWADTRSFHNQRVKEEKFLYSHLKSQFDTWTYFVIMTSLQATPGPIRNDGNTLRYFHIHRLEVFQWRRRILCYFKIMYLFFVKKGRAHGSANWANGRPMLMYFKYICIYFFTENVKKKYTAFASRTNHVCFQSLPCICIFKSWLKMTT